MRFKKTISKSSIKKRESGSCALERIKIKENKLLLHAFRQIAINSQGVVRRNAIIAIFLLHRQIVFGLIEFFPLYYAKVGMKHISIINFPGSTWINLRFRRVHLQDL